MAYSYLLKQARKSAALSIREAAALLRIPPSTLSRYEEGMITHIPPDRLLRMLKFYQIDPQKIRLDYVRETARERLFLYEKSQRIVDADFLYERYMALDERGRQNVLHLLLHESEVSARLHSEEELPQP
ncbi:MAG: helix-turn-helix transcriptional regulator [Lachnospiraceae bacterium]|nr:helix-turn-helix transcriptional regulator [Lachnospiraceae bacterium]